MFVIPNMAVSNDQAGDFVLTVDSKNRVVRKNVEIGPLLDDGMRAIVGGLEESDRVIVKGLIEARLGATVTPVPATKSAPPPGSSVPTEEPA